MALIKCLSEAGMSELCDNVKRNGEPFFTERNSLKESLCRNLFGLPITWLFAPK